jgi:hypothetical protein
LGTIGNKGGVASLRRNPRSPFWNLRYRDLDTGKWREKSTGLTDTRKAQRLAEKTSIEERRLSTVPNSPAFLVWVPGYLATHWRSQGDSRRRYGVAWQAIRTFLKAEGIIYPRQIKYAHGEAYIRWRKANPVHGRKVRHNTALLELKFLSQLVNEAIRLEFCESNPLLRLGIARTPPKIKPELTDAQIEHLRARLSGEPEWMRTCFEIALYTGCRFSECEIPMDNIDLAAGTIRLRDAKRGENDPRKNFTVPCHPKLRLMLIELNAKGAPVTFRTSRDKNGRINTFFRQCGVNASFHSLRVTFVTRCHRGGLSEAEAMRLVNHSSTLVHRIYSRLNVEDVRAAQARIPLPD